MNWSLASSIAVHLVGVVAVGVASMAYVYDDNNTYTPPNLGGLPTHAVGRRECLPRPDHSYREGGIGGSYYYTWRIGGICLFFNYIPGV